MAIARITAEPQREEIRTEALNTVPYSPAMKPPYPSVQRVTSAIASAPIVSVTPERLKLAAKETERMKAEVAKAFRATPVLLLEKKTFNISVIELESSFEKARKTKDPNAMREFYRHLAETGTVARSITVASAQLKNIKLKGWTFAGQLNYATYKDYEFLTRLVPPLNLTVRLAGQYAGVEGEISTFEKVIYGVSIALPVMGSIYESVGNAMIRSESQAAARAAAARAAAIAARVAAKGRPLLQSESGLEGLFKDAAKAEAAARRWTPSLGTNAPLESLYLKWQRARVQWYNFEYSLKQSISRIEGEMLKTEAVGNTKLLDALKVDLNTANTNLKYAQAQTNNAAKMYTDIGETIRLQAASVKAEAEFLTKLGEQASKAKSIAYPGMDSIQKVRSTFSSPKNFAEMMDRSLSLEKQADVMKEVFKVSSKSELSKPQRIMLDAYSNLTSNESIAKQIGLASDEFLKAGGTKAELKVLEPALIRWLGFDRRVLIASKIFNASEVKGFSETQRILFEGYRISDPSKLGSTVEAFVKAGGTPVEAQEFGKAFLIRVDVAGGTAAKPYIASLGGSEDISRFHEIVHDFKNGLTTMTMYSQLLTSRITGIPLAKAAIHVP